MASLRQHAAFLRDTLPPLLTRDTPQLPSQELYLLTTILATIATTHPVTLDTLRQSRIAKALKLIVALPPDQGVNGNGGRWPSDSVTQAKRILRRWERDLGSLDDLGVNLFAPEGRLNGLTPAKSHMITHKSVVVRDESIGTIWSLDRRPNEKIPLQPGHLHLTVGDWWLNLATLYLAGAIGQPGRSCISWDDDRAYALVLCAPLNQETASDRIIDMDSETGDGVLDEGSEIKFKITREGGKGVFKLMRTTGYSEGGKKVIRIFRHSNWGGRYAPRGGVRYDGLYHILSYSVSLTSPSAWMYTFTLAREPNQPSLHSALHIPTSEQFDEWEDFLALKDPGFETTSAIGAGVGLGDSMEKLERFVRTKTIMSGILEETDSEKRMGVRTPLRTLGAGIRTPTMVKEREMDEGYFNLPMRPVAS